jgi:hypothetical protein
MEAKLERRTADAALFRSMGEQMKVAELSAQIERMEQELRRLRAL